MSCFFIVGTQLYLAEWFIWPPAQFVNFYFLPTRFRVIYDNAISLGYDMYTSHVKNTNIKRFNEMDISEKYSSKKELQSKHMLVNELSWPEDELAKQDSWCC